MNASKSLGGAPTNATNPLARGLDTVEKSTYRLLTGRDDAQFCERVSAALAEGYVLHGSPAITFDGAHAIVAQAVVRPEAARRS